MERAETWRVDARVALACCNSSAHDATFLRLHSTSNSDLAKSWPSGDTRIILKTIIKMIFVSPDGQDLAKAESEVLRRRRIEASRALLLQRARATRASTR